jgi:membrane dipeptidase
LRSGQKILKPKKQGEYCFEPKIFYRYKLFSVLILASVTLISCDEKTKDTAMTEEQLNEIAQAIHKRVITLDTHCDINTNNFTDSINYTQ